MCQNFQEIIKPSKCRWFDGYGFKLKLLLVVLNIGIKLHHLCSDDPSEQQKEEFLQEIEQMKLLGAHQNIVSLVGCCTLQDPKFLVIEYVPFGDLLHWLRRRRRKVRNFSNEIFK